MEGQREEGKKVVVVVGLGGGVGGKEGGDFGGTNGFEAGY